jgi:hypothetical protein
MFLKIRGDNRARRVRVGFGHVTSSKFDKKKFIGSRVEYGSIQFGSCFRSNTIGFFRTRVILGRRVEFWVLISSDYFGLQVIQIRVGSGFGSSRDSLGFRVGSNSFFYHVYFKTSRISDRVGIWIVRL